MYEQDEISYQILYRYSGKAVQYSYQKVDNLLSFALVFSGRRHHKRRESALFWGGHCGYRHTKRVLRFGTRSARADRQSRARLETFNAQHRFPSR